mgnify:CR=1 FL=1
MLKTIILGATGVVGQQFITALQDHPWFKIEGLAASERSAGKIYDKSIRDSNNSLRWYCKEEPNNNILNMEVYDSSKINPEDYDIAFSALEADAARTIEANFAKTIPVLSSASAYRYENDVPVLLPGVNDEHSALVNEQKKRGWNGFIVPQANCTTVGLCFSLKPLHDEFGIDNVIMTSMQAVSGAGRKPGVAAFDMIDNIIPFIPQEEEKVETETQKILGNFSDNEIKPARIKVSSTCTRVNVTDAHTESILTILRKKTDVEEIKKTLKKFSDDFKYKDLPSAPKNILTITEDPYRPQPRLDRDSEKGMTTTIGRIRKDHGFENAFKYVLVSHNTRMGAARGLVLTAEILRSKKIIKMK